MSTIKIDLRFDESPALESFRKTMEQIDAEIARVIAGGATVLPFVACPHCKRGVMKQRDSFEGPISVCSGGCGRSAPREAPAICCAPVPDDAPWEWLGGGCSLPPGHEHPNHEIIREGRVMFSWRAPALTYVTFARAEGEDDAAFRARIKRTMVEQERRAREAPLVALVNAVPAWANSVAWRAAVLATRETFKDETAQVWADDATAEWLRENVDKVEHGRHPNSVKAVAWRAYRRALAPVAKVAPERRTRGPVIVVDNEP